MTEAMVGDVRVPASPREVSETLGIRDGAAFRLTPGKITHPLAQGRYQSPLRYPGAKSALAPALGRVISAATASSEVPRVDLLVEPFAGGASASLRLVGDGTVERILLADADPLVASFWQAAAADTDRLIERMQHERSTYVQRGGAVAVERWDYWRDWRPAAGVSEATARLETAVKCLFLNRTTFSGILHGRAGPIGGRAQTSPYGIGCRWNQQGLEERLRFIGHLYYTGRLVDVWLCDWQRTLEDVPERFPQLIPSRVVAYLDPPYLEKSEKLYRTSFDPHGGYAAASDEAAAQTSERVGDLHLKLAEYLRERAQFRWVLSYDADHTLIQDPRLYARREMNPSSQDRELLGVHRWRISRRLLSTRYSASGKSGKRAASELLLTTLPPSTVPLDEEFRSTHEWERAAQATTR
ncbi:DNA adenine methylase [Xylanimonas ulmi]|uniref:site-specific DNA-methyltransferase (adenine-specific) n=1 Tax=Xylanimonas ulmi TaxID=228973 RepID=A0A4Q7M416_9MICO|nr:DNA adenine methylase [Xylanibacterium ulmi]RZS60719.1 DNA adenine methylase [Xylanibacterium ulmi]